MSVSVWRIVATASPCGRRRVLDLVAQAVGREDLLRDLVVLLVGPGQLLLGQVHLGAHVHAGELEVGLTHGPDHQLDMGDVAVDQRLGRAGIPRLEREAPPDLEQRIIDVGPAAVAAHGDRQLQPERRRLLEILLDLKVHDVGHQNVPGTAVDRDPDHLRDHGAAWFCGTLIRRPGRRSRNGSSSSGLASRISQDFSGSP